MDRSANVGASAQSSLISGSSPRFNDDLASTAFGPELFRKILGVRFFVGSVEQAVDVISCGGLLVVPAAPALIALPSDDSYREALIGADFAIPDSAFMVLLWNFLQSDSIPKISGLLYLRELLTRKDVRTAASTLWVMARPESCQQNLNWLREQGISVPDEYLYCAPFYEEKVLDEALLSKIEKLRPRHIVLTIGGGKQEQLGYYLKQHLSYTPAIHCIGAAIAFLSGDQVRIPVWADKCGLGWLFRCMAEPSRFIPRYWGARQLLPILARYRDRLPLD